MPKVSISSKPKLSTSSRVFLLLGALSLVGTLVSCVYLDVPVAHVVPALLAEGALIFLSALIVERSLLKEFAAESNQRTDELAKTVTSMIEKYFQSRFEDLKYTEQYGVHLAPPRRSVSKNPGETYKKIAEAIRRSTKLKIFCTSGIDIFPPPNAISNPIVDAIRNKARIAAESAFSIAVLSCNPTGDYANIRGRLENKVHPDYVCRDIENAQRSLEEIASDCKEFSWEWYTHEIAPQAWFLLTDTEGFAEVYHIGLGRRAPSNPNSCIGGRVPVLHFGANSGLWQALNEYFDFLTTASSNTDFEDVRTNYFGIKLAKQSPNSPTQPSSMHSSTRSFATG